VAAHKAGALGVSTSTIRLLAEAQGLG